MIISLIGISNCGKSYWAERLEQGAGFFRLCCDEMIENCLSSRLDGNKAAGTVRVAHWLGQPYETGYAEREREYLDCEEQAVCSALQTISSAAAKSKTNIVIDTTGSVIYLNAQVLKTLKEKTSVVYLEVSAEQIEEMFAKYLNDSKPVIWNKMFAQKKDESPAQALARCYPLLFRSRLEQYQKLADYSLPFAAHSSPQLSVQSFLDNLRSAGVPL